MRRGRSGFYTLTAKAEKKGGTCLAHVGIFLVRLNFDCIAETPRNLLRPAHLQICIESLCQNSPPLLCLSCLSSPPSLLSALPNLVPIFEIWFDMDRRTGEVGLSSAIHGSCPWKFFFCLSVPLYSVQFLCNKAFVCLQVGQ